MKKSKFIVFLLVSVLLSFSFTNLSFGADTGTVVIGEGTGVLSSDGEDYIIRIEATGDANKEITILVYEGDATTVSPEEKNIVYIDQVKSDANGKVSIDFPLGKTDKNSGTGNTKNYVVKVGGEGVATPASTIMAVKEAVKPSYKLGDVNGDGLINSDDALFALKCSVKLETPTAEQMLALDVDGNGTINSDDALYILQYSVKIRSKFPVEEK